MKSNLAFPKYLHIPIDHFFRFIPEAYGQARDIHSPNEAGCSGFLKVLSVTLLLTGLACKQTGPIIKSPPAQIPALESIFTDNGPQRVVAQNTDGAYSLTPPLNFIQFRVRAPWPTEFYIFMDNIALQKVDNDGHASNHPEFDQQGYFWYSPDLIPGEGFFRISAIPPLSLRGGKLGQQIGVQIRNVSLDKTLPLDQQEANLFLRFNTNLPVPFAPPTVLEEEPNTVFDHGENSKDYQNPWPGPLEPHSIWCIVARKVSVAGWLIDAPGRNDGSSKGAASGQTEDWHYDILIDNDYILRNYGPSPSAAPLAMTVLPGHPSDFWPFGNPKFNDISFINGQDINAGLFLLPNQDHFWGELNAWHKSARGNPPNLWINDTDPMYFDNAWPFDPMLPFRVSNADPPLQAGDYVVISGTLWQDSGHTKGNTDPADPGYIKAKCWEHHFVGHDGWLEIHPVDMVRKIRPPVLQKTPRVVSLCTQPNQAAVDSTLFLKPEQPRSDNTKTLKFKVIDDNRFTKSSTINQREEVIVEGSDGPSLKIHLNIGNATEGGCFKAVYLLWWE